MTDIDILIFISCDGAAGRHAAQGTGRRQMR